MENIKLPEVTLSLVSPKKEGEIVELTFMDNLIRKTSFTNGEGEK